MRQIVATMVQRAAAVSAGLLMLLFMSAAHTAMRPMQAHAMGGMERHNHNSAPSTNCATLCTSAVVKRDDGIRHAEEEHDDELQPTPFVPQFDRAFFEGLYAFTYDKQPPPSKVPIYKLYGVLLS